MKDKSFYIVVFSTILILVSIVFDGTYAYFVASVGGTGNTTNNTTTVDTDDMSDLVIAGKSNISSNLLIPGESISSTFTISNENDVNICFTLYWTNVTNTFVNQNDLIVTLTDSNNNVLVSNKTFPNAASILSDTMQIKANTTEIYTVNVTYQETDGNQLDDMGKSFGATITGELSTCKVNL